MAISFVSAGTEVATTTTTLALVAPTIVSQDILFALIVSNNNTAVSAPVNGGPWNLIADTANTAAMQTYLAWKQAGIDASGATFNFTVAGTTLSYGVLVAYRGARSGGTIIGGFSTSANASADNVTFATLTPKEVSHIIAFGAYNLSATTAGAFSGTNPTFTSRVDVETATGNTASLFVQDGPVLTLAATGSRTLATASTVDAINHGYLVELLPQVTESVASYSSGPKYPSIQRKRS